MKKICDIARLNKIVQLAKHEEEVAVTEQRRTCLLDEEVLSLGKWDNEIGVRRHYCDHERQWRKNTEESALKEPAERNLSRRNLLVHHGETDNETRHDEEHVYANETTVKHSDA